MAASATLAFNPTLLLLPYPLYVLLPRHRRFLGAGLHLIAICLVFGGPAQSTRDDFQGMMAAIGWPPGARRDDQVVFCAPWPRPAGRTTQRGAAAIVWDRRPRGA